MSLRDWDGWLDGIWDGWVEQGAAAPVLSSGFLRKPRRILSLPMAPIIVEPFMNDDEEVLVVHGVL